MMKHVIFFFHILSFLFGSANIMVLVLAYIKCKKLIFKELLFFISALTAFLFVETLSSYNLVNFIVSYDINMVLKLIAYLATMVMIYYLPRLVNTAIHREPTFNTKMILMLTAILPLVFMIFFYFTSFKDYSIVLTGSILFIVILYCVIMAGMHFKEIKEPFMKRAIKNMLIITLLFLPYMYLDTRIEKIEYLNSLFPYGLVSLPMYYIVFSVLCIYYIVKYISLNKAEPDHNVFFEKYSITKREQEIILLLVKGYTYNELADELCISMATVKTHVHNIYIKTEVKSKIQLMYLIRAEKNTDN